MVAMKCITANMGYIQPLRKSPISLASTQRITYDLSTFHVEPFILSITEKSIKVIKTV